MPLYFRKIVGGGLDPETNGGGTGLGGYTGNDVLFFRVFNDGLVDNPMLRGANPVDWFYVFNDQTIDAVATDTGSVPLVSDGFYVFNDQTIDAVATDTGSVPLVSDGFSISN